MRRRLRYRLTGFQMADDVVEYMELYRETDAHLIVPREATKIKLKGPVTDLRPTWRRHRIRSTIVLDALRNDQVQSQAMAAWLEQEHGVLSLGCGIGKTVVALESVARTGLPTLVLVPSTVLLQQWQDRAHEFLPDLKVGVVHQDTWDWRRLLTIASIFTVRERPQEVTPEFRHWPGQIIWDEVHHLPAEGLSATADLFPGRRYGLSATTVRGDGRDPVVSQNLGPIFYEYLIPDDRPLIRFQLTPLAVNLMDRQYHDQVFDRGGQLNVSMIRSFLGQYEPNNRYTVDYIQRVMEHRDKILVLTHSKDQVFTLADMLARAGVTDMTACTGDDRDTTQRLELIRTSKLTVATAQLAREALDVPRLDTLILLTPFGGSTPGSNAMQQSMGRLLRICEGKKEPLVIVFCHHRVVQIGQMATNLMTMLDRWPANKGGPLAYTIVGDQDLPEELK